MTDLNRERFSAYDSYLSAAAEQLDKPVEDDLVKVVAATRLQLDLVIEEQLAGRTPDTADLLRIGDALRSFAPQEPERRHTVILKLVEPRDGAIPTMPCRRCGWRHGDDIPALPLPQSEVRDVTPVASAVTDVTPDTKVLEPDMITPPVKRVRHNEQPEEPLFSACTIGKGVQTSDRWTR